MVPPSPRRRRLPQRPRVLSRGLFEKNAVYGVFGAARLLTLESTQSLAVALKRSPAQVEPIWTRAKEARDRATCAIAPLFRGTLAHGQPTLAVGLPGRRSQVRAKCSIAGTVHSGPVPTRATGAGNRVLEAAN
jgi:hypothetical protein